MKKTLIMNVFIILTIVIILAGCNLVSNEDAQTDEEDFQEKLVEKEDKIYIDADPQPTEVTITLYYKHEIADFLVPEQRTVSKDKQSLEQLVVEELLKGPQTFGKVMVMPPEVSVIDVTRKGNTVFVNLSSEFIEDIDLNTIPGKQNVPEEDKKDVLAEMKRLAVYSIVNSITDLEGGLQVKLLVDNRQLTYRELGAQLLVEDAGNIDIDTPMMAIERDKDFILSPSRAVEYVLKGMTGEPNYDIVYKFLYSKMSNDRELPSLEEFQKLMTAVDISLETDETPIDEEEIKSDGHTAYVTAHYIIKHDDGKEELREKYVFTVVREDGIWKVVLPDIFFSKIKG